MSFFLDYFDRTVDHVRPTIDSDERWRLVFAAWEETPRTWLWMHQYSSGIHLIWRGTIHIL